MRSRSQIHLSRSRHGVSIVYVAVAMMVLVGFCSLAVDLGRVQVAKTELERAADAAARAGAASLPSGVSAVQTAAYNIANSNCCDGQAVTIDSINDVVFLNWPSTTPLTGSARTSANAVQVSAHYAVPLIFAQAIGKKKATVHATSTAEAIPPAAGYGVIGYNSLTLDGCNTVDSYDSRNGNYGGQNEDEGNRVYSHGQISVCGGAHVDGEVDYDGPSPNESNGYVTGQTSKLGSSVTVPLPAAPNGCTDVTNSCQNINNNQTLTLTSGNYVCTKGCSLKSGGTLTINANSGPVNLYCSGNDFDWEGGSINVTGSLPGNFHVYMCDNSNVTLHGGGKFCGCVHAPDSDCDIDDNCDCYGQIAANNCHVNNGSNCHYDESLSSGTAATIVQVH